MIGGSDGILTVAMGRALTLAAEAAVTGDVPVGAVVIGPAVAARAHVAAVSHPADAVGTPSAARTCAAAGTPADVRTRVVAEGRSAAGTPAAQSFTAAAGPDSALTGPDPSWQIIGEGRNRRDQAHDPFAHAEIEAIQAAAATLGRWNLADCTLVVSLEPCPMCAGAAVMSHVGRLVFGAWDEKMGACGSVWDIPRDPHIGFAPEVISGLRERECTAVLKDFFAARRVGR